MRRHVARAVKVMEGKEDSEKVHILRTGIKRLRASWRLLRPALSDPVFRRENHALKKASLGLAPLRETHVLGKTIRKLREETGKRVSRKKAAPIDEAWKRLEASLHSGRDPAPEVGRTILEKTLGSLQTSLERFQRLDPEAAGYRRLNAFLGKSYRKAGKAGAHPGRSGDSGFHEWRKRVKDHFYQVQALKPLLSPRAEAVLEGLDRLQDALGDHHDLAALDSYFRGHAGLIPDRKSARKAGSFLGKERKRLRKKSRRLGRPLFKRKPARYQRRLLPGGVRKRNMAGPAKAA
jgi:CHAD domain-containing protein